jgi:hypothetical protein
LIVLLVDKFMAALAPGALRVNAFAEKCPPTPKGGRVIRKIHEREKLSSAGKTNKKRLGMPRFQRWPPFRTASQEDERYGGVFAGKCFTT